ncbi:mannitol dehydrogenase family protein [Roseobacter sinensis]|uniref:Mannitol dehydrogenase family protein n=1 Tax=Roseobacter sinensis TaxID=2931391 RepID=A0ABT3B9L7_9RHOB|nr:mannitol dehydrogenase family protein [Roseobacter sp. WL0113]MCV3270277.1 mannitol dehydrogenase family protein [Roseobacter sp. WL0113]
MTPRILHIGVGNFARAHLADYTQDAGGWRITGVSLRSGKVRDGLRAQGYSYGLAVQGQGIKQIDVLDEVLVAPEAPGAVLAQIADPDVHIISVTVTEKGYHLTSENTLDLDDPLIAQDLAAVGPRTVIGFLAHGLAARQTPVTVLSCDNRANNGDVLKAAVVTFSAEARLDMGQVQARFPNCMVDRITPATTDALRAETGDAMVVPTEPFREWVIEDHFAGPRPDWPDVVFTDEVAPHEMRKLRMLNGAHSMLAYAGTLAGHTYVHEAMADPALRAQARALMDEVARTLSPDMQKIAPSYADALVARFDNPHINHSLRQIAMDGTQKLPYRMVDSLRALLGEAPALAAGIRAWLAFCRAEVAAGRPPEDPKAEAIVQIVDAGGTEAQLLSLIGAEDLARSILE